MAQSQQIPRDVPDKIADFVAESKAINVRTVEGKVIVDFANYKALHVKNIPDVDGYNAVVCGNNSGFRVDFHMRP